MGGWGNPQNKTNFCHEPLVFTFCRFANQQNLPHGSANSARAMIRGEGGHRCTHVGVADPVAQGCVDAVRVFAGLRRSTSNASHVAFVDSPLQNIERVPKKTTKRTNRGEKRGTSTKSASKRLCRRVGFLASHIGK